MKLATGILVGALIGVAVYAGLRLYDNRGMDPAYPCEALVRIEREGEGFKVKPKDVCLLKGHDLTWDLTDIPEGDEVEIVFEGDAKKKAKPFEYKPDDNKDNIGPGHYKKKTSTTMKRIKSNKAKSVGRWKYEVWWIPADGHKKKIDPAICIRR